jgi:molecular chaperone GrpE (heat shock protein)
MEIHELASMIARVDERTKILQSEIESIQADMKECRKKLESDIDIVDKKSAQIYITKDTFLPVQRAMFAAITTLVGAVIMAAINFIFRPLL